MAPFCEIGLRQCRPSSFNVIKYVNSVAQWFIISSRGITLGRIEVVRREWWGLKGSLRHIAREMFKPIISMTNNGLFTRYECRCS